MSSTKPANAETALASETEAVTLKAAHVHRRETYQAGERIYLRPDQAKRLKARKIAAE